MKMGEPQAQVDQWLFVRIYSRKYMKYTKYMTYSIVNCWSKLDPGGCVYEDGRAPGTGCGDVRGQLMPLGIMLLTVLAFSIIQSTIIPRDMCSQEVCSSLAFGLGRELLIFGTYL